MAEIGSDVSDSHPVCKELLEEEGAELCNDTASAEKTDEVEDAADEAMEEV